MFCTAVNILFPEFSSLSSQHSMAFLAQSSKVFPQCPQTWSGLSHQYPTILVPTCLSRVTISVMKHHDQKQLGEERVYFTHHSYNSPTKAVRVETHKGRNLEAGADAEAMEGCCLLPCFPWLAQPAFHRT